MNTEIIGQSWDKLADKRAALGHTFFERLLEQYPKYKPVFPESASKRLEKLVRTLALVARMDEPEVVHPQMIRLGNDYRQFNLAQEDLVNFKQVFLDVLGEYCRKYSPEAWDEACVEAWNQALEEHVIPYMAQGLNDNMTPSQRKRIINMQTAAGNQLSGTIISLKEESLFVEVLLKLDGGDQLAAIITPVGVNNLGLTIGSQAYALIKPPHIMLMHADTGLKVSARNHFCGKVIKEEVGTINTRVTLQLKSGNIFQALVSKENLAELDIKEGERVCCAFRAIDVILAVENEF